MDRESPHSIGRGRIAAAPRECYPRDWRALGLIGIEAECEDEGKA